ncbi:MAG TPA: protein kinase [Polyangiaceae bacterium]|jgi:hypothetical protein
MHEASQDSNEDEQVSDAELLHGEESFADSANSRDRLEQLRVGAVLAGKYRVERVHRGSFSSLTVEALHSELGQRIVLKLLLADPRTQPESVARFLRGARAAARIRGDHVARILDIGALDSGVPFVASDHLVGSDLRGVLGVRERLPVPEAVDLLLQAAEGLAEAHRLGLVHGNLKLSNLFLVRQPDGPQQLKVLDFCVSDDPFTGAVMDRASIVTPSLGYLSPEQIREPGELDARVDIWALGAILHELLTGSRAFEASTTPGLLAMIVADPPPSASSICPDVPAELESIIFRCLAKNREDRPANVFALASTLQPFASAEGIRSIERIGKLINRRTRSTLPPPMPSQAPDDARAPTHAIVHLGSSAPPVDHKTRRKVAELALVAVGFAAAAAGGAFIAARTMQSALAASATRNRSLVAELSPAVAEPVQAAASAAPRAPSVIPVASAPKPSTLPAPMLAARPRAPTPPAERAPRAEIHATPDDGQVAEEPSSRKPATLASKPTALSARAQDLFDDAN